ncbi:uncharacterized protein LOC122243739 [Penaeus japonicus]|uniref:uncharacterized protein LOC122243739 n=1 Tax=Penaeus japonicus TaxID=27405 RepID=UPI001C711E5A|nr:uncharacterized protein LOC122243739 [Penaeus japonicus]
MGFFSLPIIGNSLLFPTILTSLIVGFVFLILSEKRRVSGGEARSDSKSPAKDASLTGADPKPREKEEGADADVDGEGVERTGSDSGVKGESSSCSSGSEEEAGDKKAKSKRKRKHSCEGAKACSSKKTVSDVVVWTSEGEQSKGCVDEFTSGFATGGLNCSTCLLLDESRLSFSFLEGGPSTLNLFMLTSMESCEELINTLRQHTRNDEEERAQFIYSIACLAETSTGPLLATAHRLNDELAEKGGNEWLPVACISSSEQKLEDQEVFSPQKYTTKVLNKVKKISKKCCGTSCGTKKSVDIEDLAASLLPSITPVKT